MPPSLPPRIAVVGTSGSGKTTFARALARRLGVPHVELDALHWGPDWTPNPDFREATRAAVASEAWVVDGNYSAVRDLVWARATTVVWLNYPFHVVFGRAARRTFRRLLRREVLWAGNRERLRNVLFSRDSILWWVLTTYRRRRRAYPGLFEQPAHRHLRVVTFGSPREAEAFLARLPAPYPAGATPPRHGHG